MFFMSYTERMNLIKKITIKTAVGSPGFIEVILNYAVPTTFSVIFIVNTVLGKLKDSDGSTKKELLD